MVWISGRMIKEIPGSVLWKKQNHQYARHSHPLGRQRDVHHRHTNSCFVSLLCHIISTLESPSWGIFIFAASFIFKAVNGWMPWGMLPNMRITPARATSAHTVCVLSEATYNAIVWAYWSLHNYYPRISLSFFFPLNMFIIIRSSIPSLTCR